MKPKNLNTFHCTPAPIAKKESITSIRQGKGKRKKQHSEILTSTPMKAILEASALKKTLKNIKERKK